jgi:3',5'-cyclic AMP phosphodiesterase CpdA
MHRNSLTWHASLLLSFLGPLCLAHVGSRPSVHDTVAGIVDRLSEQLSTDDLRSLSREQLEQLLTVEERETLGAGHITFRVNRPVKLSILRDTQLGGEPFWLSERGFASTGELWEESGHRFDRWQKNFPAGAIGLGVNSLSGGGEHYLVVVEPLGEGAALAIDELYPGQLRVTDFVPGVAPYADRSETVAQVPESLQGQKLIQTLRDRRNDARVLGIFRVTDYPSSDLPDQVVLTWSGDPKTTQAIQWRTATSAKRGIVAYQERAQVNRLSPRRFLKVKARTEVLEDKALVNDPRIHRHTVELKGLKPGTTYLYCVGDGSRNGWSELAEFTTAPDRAMPFSFIYMGDAQNGLDRWGTLARNAFRERPDAAFYLMAGDLVNRGNERDDWDSFFSNAASIFDRRQLAPVIGNHECQGGHPSLYLKQFALPIQGPPGLEAERAYAFEYGNALFVILDSNLDPETQAAWLEEQLANTQATWKFVTYHHPAYSSAPNRDNRRLRDAWTPLFDKYHVDLALQGHDHAYLRTHPLHNQQRVESTQEGTVYIVSVSGTKMYSQAERDTTAFGMTKVSTYQVLDIQISGDRLLYRAYDIDGTLRDEFVIEK